MINGMNKNGANNKEKTILDQKNDLDLMPMINRIDIASPVIEPVNQSLPLISQNINELKQSERGDTQKQFQLNQQSEEDIVRNLIGNQKSINSLEKLDGEIPIMNKKMSSKKEINDNQNLKKERRQKSEQEFEEETERKNNGYKKGGEKEEENEEDEDIQDDNDSEQSENLKTKAKLREEDIEHEVKNLYKNLTPKEKLKMKIYLTLFDAEYSKLSKRILIFMLLISITDVVLMILSTEQSLPIGEQHYWEYFNQYSAIIFFIGKCLQIYSCDAFKKGIQAYKDYFFQFNIIVDYLALFYSVFEAIAFHLDFQFDDQIKILRALFTLRLIRVFRFSSINRGINILVAGVKQSVQALSILLFITIICIILISSFMYFAEKGQSNSKIENIPEAVWWAVITITTVGYGDLIPQTLFGKIIASISLIFGVLLLSLPVAIIGNNFQEIYLQNQKNDKNQSKKSMKRQFEESKNEEEKEILRIWLKINELEEVNETIERCLQENQFLYRSIAREAQTLINRIDFSDKKSSLAKFGDSYVEGYDRQDPIVQKIKDQYIADNQIQSFISFRAKEKKN